MPQPAGRTPSAARQVRVLPLPDSPTSPTISPARTWREAPRTAVAAPWCTLTCRSSMRSTSSPAAPRSAPRPVRGLVVAESGNGLRLSITIGVLQGPVGVDDRVDQDQRPGAAPVAEG